MNAGPELIAESCGADVFGCCAYVVEESCHKPCFVKFGIRSEIP